MPHYYFDLTDGVTRLDWSGMDCADDAAAVVKAAAIADEVAAAGGGGSEPNFHVTITHEDGHQLSRVPVKMKQTAYHPQQDDRPK